MSRWTINDDGQRAVVVELSDDRRREVVRTEPLGESAHLNGEDSAYHGPGHWVA